MTREEAFYHLYDEKNYPPEYKKGLFDLFNRVYFSLSKRMKEEGTDIYFLDPDIVMSYVCEEHIFNVSHIPQDKIDNLINNPTYIDRMVVLISDKFYINEILGYEPKVLLSEYNPLVTTFNFFLNFILNKYKFLNKSKKLNDNQRLILDILKKGFLMTKSVVYLLTTGNETEAFATWRTIHEVECIAKDLATYPYLTPIYLRHIEYARYYRTDNGNPDYQNALFQEIKEKMKEVSLKSKDTKKFVEYGWLYSVKDVNEKFKEFKPNFRKGVELIAGLESYSSLYELSSEIAHSSPLLIYSNADYFKSLTLINLYETFFRLETLFNNILISLDDIDSKAYYSMRKDYLFELNKNLLVEKMSFASKYQNEEMKKIA